MVREWGHICPDLTLMSPKFQFSNLDKPHGFEYLNIGGKHDFDEFHSKRPGISEARESCRGSIDRATMRSENAKRAEMQPASSKGAISVAISRGTKPMSD